MPPREVWGVQTCPAPSAPGPWHVLFPLPKTPFLPFLPNSLLFALWTLTFGKCPFLGDTFSVLPRPSRFISNSYCMMYFS